MSARRKTKSKKESRLPRVEDFFLPKLPPNMRHKEPAAAGLLRKRQELEQVDHALEHKRREFANRMQIVKERRNLLFRKRLILKAYLAVYEVFIRWKESIRHHALAEARKQRDLTEEKIAKAEELREEIAQLKRQRIVFMKQAERYAKYVDSVESMTKTKLSLSGKDFMVHNESGAATHRSLSLESEEAMATLERTRAAIRDMQKQASDNVLHFPSRVTTLLADLDLAQRETERWAEELNRKSHWREEREVQDGNADNAIFSMDQSIVRHHLKQGRHLRTKSPLTSIQHFLENTSSFLK